MLKRSFCTGSNCDICSWIGWTLKKKCKSVLWIRIRSDPKLFAGSGSQVGSEKNHFGSGSGQPLSGMNLKQNFSDKIHNFSTRLSTYKFPYNLQGARGIAARFSKWSPASTVSPIMTKFSKYTPHSTCYLVLVSICRQD
jgi:hypothetical protein